jgi:uncharacterized protein
MDFGVARQAMDSYERLIQVQEEATLKISFYGGEPLLNWRMVKETLGYGRRLINGKTEIQWILNTNGTLLTPEAATVLKEEGVDVHISIDGADEASNKYRKFKDGTPVLNQVLKSLEILKRKDCQVQFNSCLTEANLYSLHRLIDLAAVAGVDKIFLALTDCPQDQHPLIDIGLATRKILETKAYAEQKGIFLGGPWRNVMYGSTYNMAGQGNQVPTLVIEPTGQVSFPAYHGKKLGHVERLEEILASPLFLETNQEWEREKRACNGCELENYCNGYLKGVVMYHTGRLDGYDRECQLAMSVLGGLKRATNSELVLSKQLIGQYHQGRYEVMNRLAGTSLNATPEILDFLSLFKQPVHPTSLYERYNRPDIWPTASHLMNINFLVPTNVDEEAQILDTVVEIKERRVFETEHFFTYYFDCEVYLARDLTDLMEEVYRLLISKGLLPFKGKILIFLCPSRAQLKQFWGMAPMPEWVKAFVCLGRILVVDQQKIQPIYRKSAGFFRGMTHELVHIFLNQLRVHLPAWIEEGVCEYYSRPYNDSKFKKLVREKRLYGFREMEALVRHSLLDLDTSPVGENICYQQAHSFVYFITRPTGEKKFIECIRTTGLCKDFHEVFEEHYGQSLDDLELEWKKKYSSVNFKKMKPSINLRIIKKNHRVLLYNAFYGQSLIANDNMLDLLKFINLGKTISDISEKFEISDLHHVISNLYSKGLIVFDDEPEKDEAYRDCDEEKTGRLITTLRLNLTNTCNMSCNYCYVRDVDTSDEIMPWHIAKKALDNYFALLKRNGHTNSLIRLFGGEPMLNWPILEHILDYVQTIKGEIQVDYILNTNGIILTPYMAQKILQHKVRVAVSLDGVGTTNDRFRKLRSGRGSFSVIDRNLDMLLANGCCVGIETTLGDHNCGHLKELVDYLVHKGAIYNCEIPLGLQNITIVPKDGLDSLSMDDKIEEIIEVILYAREKGLDAMVGMVTLPFNTLLEKRRPGAYCKAIGQELCVYPNGDIYPCGNIKIKMGSVEDMDGIFTSEAYIKMSQRVAGNIAACQGCDIEAFCAGGCSADAMASNGDIFNRTINCKLEKLVFKALVNELLLGTEEKENILSNHQLKMPMNTSTKILESDQMFCDEDVFLK